MSNIYNLEPTAYGLITLKTTFGDLELELFTKQCPKITKNFVQLCLDGYYDESIFDHVEKDFIAIGGTQNKPGAESIELDILPDEFHQRLKFSRRGLLATANTEKNANGAKFFFTLGPTPELQNKHSIFGRLKGNSIYHLVDLNDCNVDNDLRPLSEKKIIQVIVTQNPFPELQVRPDIKEKLKGHQANLQDESDDAYLKPKFNIKQSKQLSFYRDSDDDDDEKEGVGKADEVVSTNNFKVPQKKNSQQGDANVSEIANALDSEINDPKGGESKTSEDDREKKLREIREQIRKLKQKLENESATKIRTLSDRRQASVEQANSLNASQDSKANSSKHSSFDDPDLASSSKEVRLATKKGRQRERETIELMQQFKKKLKNTLPNNNKHEETGNRFDPSDRQYVDDDQEIEQALDLVDGDDWLRHKFDAQDDSTKSLAKDANTRGHDWYPIDDPRNPMVERVESERARDCKRIKERDRHWHDTDRDKKYRSEHRSGSHCSR